MHKYRPVLIIGLVLAVAIIGGLLLYRRNTSNSFTGGPLASPLPTATFSPSPDTSQQPAIVVKLEEFGDYQCPPCGELHPELKKIKQDFGSSLDFVFRNLPLESIHKNALTAARAAEAARMQNRFWEMHDLLYEKQEEWQDKPRPDQFFIKLAADLGLEKDRFVRDFYGDQVQMRIQADIDAAVRLGINGTPTILIDGRQLKTDATTPEGIRRGIDLMMARKGDEAR